LVGGAATWPLAVRAQQMPVIGFLSATTANYIERLRAFHRGLKDGGYAEGENVDIVYRSAEGQYDRLPEFAAEFVGRRVNVIVAGAEASTLAAKAATSTIPVVFIVAENPVSLGIVASIARPERNLTGVNLVSSELAAKRLEFMRELVPHAVRVAVLVNPANASNTETTLRDVETAARDKGLQIRVLRASTGREIEAAFAELSRERPDLLFVGTDPFFTSRRVQLANLSSRHGLPMTASTREVTDAGGLMSYGSNIADAFRQAGVYTGRILKGVKPADLPVVQSTKLEFVINAGTARMLGLTVPPTLLTIADEVIE
jgi:putative ABC transport system substrate-binding protein